ncbi:MAG: transketolase [Candidatus Portnoybacteria bacterium]|nr:transketolase [Candidatus Portnoybacteria bacterium]
MRHRSGAYHIGGDLSCADILAVLYEDILRVNPKKPGWSERDRFIQSKGHSCAPLYAVLAIKKFFPFSWLDTFYQNGGKLAGHVTRTGVPGIEASTGSLGHGLSLGCGMAIAGKRDKKRYRVFVLMSDGELDEGSNWEAILFAGHHHLDNLTVIVDYNKIQSLGRTEEVLNLEPLGEKWRAFNWSVKEIDGHNHKQIAQTLSRVPFEKGKPSAVIAHTIKGKGVSFIENTLDSHYQVLDNSLLNKALKEIV